MTDDVGPVAFLRALFNGTLLDGPRHDARFQRAAIDDDRYPQEPVLPRLPTRERDRVETRPRTVADATQRRRSDAAARRKRQPQRPADPPVRERRTAEPRERHADQGDVRFTPPLPTQRPGDVPSSVPMRAPIAPAVDFSPFARDPIVQVSPGSLLGSISAADFNARFQSPQGGHIDRLTIAPGTQLPATFSVRDGVVREARVDVLDRDGRPTHLGGPVNIGGVDLTDDRRIVPRIQSGFARFFAGLFGMDNQTDAIFSGQRRVPVDPHQFFRSLGVTSEVSLLGPDRGERHGGAKLAELRRAIDLEGSPVSATVQLKPSSELVSFGEGMRIAFAPGSRATFTRENGLDRFDIDANVSGAIFGVDGGPNVRMGQASLHIVARQILEHGAKKWVVTIANPGDGGAGVIRDVHLRIPVREGEGRVNELHLGDMRATNGGNPLITMTNGKLTVGFDTRLTDVTGALHLTDHDHRQGVLTLGAGRNPREGLRVQARIDMVTSAEHPAAIESLRVVADTNGLNLGLSAPRGVQIASGEGFSFGVQNGTSLVGSGRMIYTLGGDQTANFTLESQQGVQADIRLFGTKVNRSLGEIGVRTDLQNGALLRARVRSLDWASRGLDMNAEIQATVDRATMRLPTQEQATVRNATATGQAHILYVPGDESPQVRGNLRLEVAAAGNGTRDAKPGLSFLPRGVPGFDRANGEAGVQAQLTDGKLVANLPFTINRDGSVVTRNESDTAARVQFERLAVDTVFNTEGARAAKLNVGLPMLADVQRAEQRHRELEAGLAILPIPELDRTVDPDPRNAVDDVAKRVDLAALVRGALQEADIDLTVRVPRDHTITLVEGPFADLGTKTLTIPQGTMRLVIESDGGRVTNQLPTRPDGSDNPTKNMPSGITFNPPLRMTFNPSDRGRWWNYLSESTLEVKGLDFVPSADDPDRITVRPRLGNASFGDAWLVRAGTQAFEGWVSQQLTGAAMRFATGSSEVPTTVQELAARVAQHAHVQIDTRADIIERAIKNLTPSDQQFVRDTVGRTDLLARAQLRPGQTIRFGNDQLRIESADDVRIVRQNGQTIVTGRVTFGESAIRAPNGTSLSLAGVSATLRLVQGENAEHPELTSLELTDVAAPQLTFTQADRQTYAVRDGRAQRIVLSSGNVVTVEGLTGSFSGNLLYNGSQVWVQSARLTNGSLRMDAAGAITAGPLALTDLVATATNIAVPPENNDPAASGVSAQIHRLDMRAGAATLTVDPRDGINLVTPANNRARVAVQTDATFVFPSPRMHVAMTNARSSGYLEALRIGPTSKNVSLHDWYVETDGDTGEVSGTIVAGPAGTQASNLRIEPTYTDAKGVTRRARFRAYVGRLGFTQQGRDQRVDVVMAGRLDAAFRVPEEERPLPPQDAPPTTYARASGVFTGSVDFSTRSQGRPISPSVTSEKVPPEIAAIAHFELANGDITADVSVSAPDAIEGRRNATDAVLRRWNARVNRAVVPPDPVRRDQSEPPRLPPPVVDERERARRVRAEEQARERAARRVREQDWSPFNRDHN